MSRKRDRQARQKTQAQKNRQRDKESAPAARVASRQAQGDSLAGAGDGIGTRGRTLDRPAPDSLGDDVRPSPLLLTVAQLGQLLNVSRSTLYRMEQAGQLPGRVQIGGQVRYHLETIEDWLRAQVRRDHEQQP